MITSGSPLAGRLQAIALGNGWVNPAVQFKAHVDYAVAHSLVGNTTATALYDLLNTACLPAIAKGSWVTAAAACNGLAAIILGENPEVSPYNIQRRCPHSCPYDMSASVRWMSQPAVRQALGLSPNATFQDPEDVFPVIAALNGDNEEPFEQKLLAVRGGGSSWGVVLTPARHPHPCTWHMPSPPPKHPNAS